MSTNGSHYDTGQKSKHLPILKWLQAIEMADYVTLFYQYAGVEDILHFTEMTFKDLGIKNSAHRAKMASSLVILQEKFHNRWKPRVAVINSTPPGSGRSTPTHTPPSLANHPDYACYAQVDITQHPQATYNTPVTVPQPLREMMKYPWYHGNIPRNQATSMVATDGDFVIRDSLSNPGDFVLTCRHNGSVLNFKVNRQTIVDPITSLPKNQYQFEEELFDRVPELIQFYVETQKPISEASGAVIRSPVGRMVSLDYGELKVSQIKLSPGLAARSASPIPQRSAPGSPAASPKASPQMRRKNLRAGSQPLLSLDEGDGSGGMDRHGSLPSMAAGVVHDPKTDLNSDSPKVNHTRSGSEPVLDTTLERQKRKGLIATESGRINTSDGDLTKPAPPKPLRTPSLNVSHKPKVEIRNKDLYADDGRDYSDYDQVKAWPAALEREQAENETMVEANDTDLWTPLDQDIPAPQDDYDEIDDEDIVEEDIEELQGDYAEISDDEAPPMITKKTVKNHAPLLRPKQSPQQKNDVYDVPKSSQKSLPMTRSSSRLSTSSVNKAEIRRPTRALTLPILDAGTVFDLNVYNSQILKPDNSILDPSSMSSIKSLLLEVMPKTVAQHLTSIDLNLLRVTGSHDLGLGVVSGLELLTLPQGEQMRLDVLERCRCLRLFVAITIVTCPQATDRARMLETWIRIAAELKSAYGNLLSFGVVMDALKMPQIQRLATTWAHLQRGHFQTHQMYEFKLRGEYRTMAHGGGNLPTQNVTVPYILPMLQRFHCDLKRLSGSLDVDLDSEEEDPLAGLETMYAHFEAARNVTAQYGGYRVCAENVMRDFVCNEHVMDMLRSELHLRFLFGMKESVAVLPEQFSKFEKIVNAYSVKMEPSDKMILPRESSL